MNIKQGSKWHNNEGKSFIVERTETRDGKDWVFYRSATKDPEEEECRYSCYTEAFTQRFREIINEY